MGQCSVGNKTYIDSVRLTRSKYTQMLEDLESARKTAPGSDRRDNLRRACQEVAGLLLQVEHPAGSLGYYIVRPRDISRTGIGFLHGGYLHKGTKANIALVMLDREVIDRRGLVVRCRHVKGLIHEVGVKFDEPFDNEPFAAFDAANAGGEAGAEQTDATTA